MGKLTVIARRKALSINGGASDSLIIYLPTIWLNMKKIKRDDVIDCYVDENYRLVLVKEPVSGKDCGKQI